MKLWHFSPRRVKVVDPAHYGANPWTSQSEQRRATMKRAYFYRADKAGVPERIVLREASYLHTTDVKLKLYDVAKGVGDDPAWERSLHARGYQGFYNSGIDGPMRHVVAVWEPVPVQGVYKLL
jgi:hypothetical protein